MRELKQKGIGGVTVVERVRKTGKTIAVKEPIRKAGGVSRNHPDRGAGVADRQSPRNTRTKQQPAMAGGKE
jgi:hypothetical protein